MTWGWHLSDGDPLPPRDVHLGDGRVIQQDVLAEALSSKLFNVKRFMFVSAAGTGKTLVAIETMTRLVADELENGKFLVYLAPYKPLQKSIIAMFSKLQYRLADGKALKPVPLYGRAEFKCPYWLARGKYNTADNCVRQDCILYLPPTTSKPDIMNLEPIARWGFWTLYGVKKDEVVYAVTSTERNTILDNAVVINDAVLCPYLAQYTELDESIIDPRILVLNYDKFLRDYMLHRITPSMIAGIIIDEADNFFSRFTPQILDVSELKVLRRMLKKQVELTKEDALEGAYEELNDAINILESEDVDGVKLLSTLGRVVRLLYESEDVDESLISEVTTIINILPNDLVEYDVIKVRNGEVLVVPKRLRFLDEFMDIPILAISATMNYVPFRALGLHNVFTVEFGQQRSPGRVILWLLKNARALVGWYIRRYVTRNIQFKELTQEALTRELFPILENMNTVNVGFAFATIYAEIAEEVGAGRVYADIVGRPLDRAIAELRAGKLVISTRFMRGINLLDMVDANTKIIFAFIPKYPRAPPGSPELMYYADLLSRGVVFTAYMHQKVYGKNFLRDVWEINEEKALADLYQAIGRGFRGDDFTVIIASTDIEVYGAVAMLAEAGFINRPLLAYDGFVLEPTEQEWSYLKTIFFNKRTNQKAMVGAYEKLKDSLTSRLDHDWKFRLIDIAPRAKVEIVIEKPSAKPAEPEPAGSGSSSNNSNNIIIKSTANPSQVGGLGDVVDKVARLFNKPASAVRIVVDFILNYLAKQGREVAIDKISDALLAAEGADIKAALQSLGVRFKDGKLTDESILLLDDILIETLRGLDSAGVVEFNEDLATVTLTRHDHS